jgi:hypothetical protein
MTEILCTRRFIKYICSLIRDQRDSAMVMKMIEFVYDHGPRTVDFVLERIADFAFSVWTIGCIKLNSYIKTISKYLITSQID